MSRSVRPAPPVVALTVALSTCWAAVASAADVATISHGERVSLSQNLVPGKLVVFDFYADWCGPCRSLTPKLEALAAENPDRVALRKVDIVNWGSDVASQYGIRSIPHLKLYDAAGTLVSEGSGWQVLGDLERTIEAMRVPGAEQQVGAPQRAFERSGGTSHLVPMLVIGTFVLVLMSFLARGLFPSRGPSGTPAARMLPSDPEKVWYARPAGRPLDGPFTPAELSANAAGFGWPPDTPVRRKGDPAWRPLSDVAGG